MKTMDELAARLKDSLDELTGKAETLRDDTHQSVRRSTETLHEHFDGIDRGLRGLNDVLEQLGQKQVVVTMHRPKRFGWLFGRRNGE